MKEFLYGYLRKNKQTVSSTTVPSMWFWSQGIFGQSLIFFDQALIFWYTKKKFWYTKKKLDGPKKSA